MRILFIHQNFPGQFKHLAPALVRAGHEVVALKLSNSDRDSWGGVRIVNYYPKRSSTKGVHPWILDLETKTIRAEEVFRTAIDLKASGFEPDVIIAHPGWGESIFLKNVWPNTKLGIYCEFYYRYRGADIGFDPEFINQDPAEQCRIELKNVNTHLHESIADKGISPTHWQASTFPSPLREKISVIHDGIDTEAIKPDPNVQLTLSNPNGSITLTKNSEVVTFVNRNLEPYRGYHIFMRALPQMLKQRPNAYFLIVGGDQVSYGAAPEEGRSWRKIFLDEVKPLISTEDMSRVRFLGNVAYENFIPLLQLSTVHIYLTYPFVLSWSLLEAMSAGCAIVASNTTPLHEAIVHNETGKLVDFFDVDGLVSSTVELLSNPEERVRLGQNARRFAQSHYDLRNVCLPQQLKWVDELYES